MAITEIFKKNKEKVEKKEEPKKEKPKETKKKVSVKKPLMAWEVLKNPYISEKATDLEKTGKYVFKVSDNANKPRVKQAVKEIYGIDVLDVRIVKIPRKRKRLGRHQGWKKGFKKAIVKTKKGQKLDINPQ